ncbi:MAG: TIGR00266 family protein [Methylococcales bacterium]|nr:TIGR00266 family protein [Methylococcales bacterium]
MHSHQVDYTIIGHDIQMVEIALDPGEAVIAEAGTMTYLEQDITFEAKMGDGSASGVMGKLFGLGKRMLTGESVFLTHFTNKGKTQRHVGFSAPFPGSIIPLNLAELGEEVICQKDSFLAAALGTQVDVAFHKRLGSGFFGGEGFILQRLRGDGMAFIHAGGTILKKELKNETLRLDTGCLVGFCGDIDYDIKMSGGLKSMFFGGEGMFLATLSGTGSVWIQSMPFSRLAERVLSHSVASTQGED